MNEQREAIARSMTSGFSRRVWDGNFNPSPESEYNKAVRDHVRSDYLNDADLVIAHLWQAADDPAVHEAVAQGIHAEVWRGDEYMVPWDKCRQERYMADARIALTVGLAALLGPNPNEQGAER